MEISVPYPTQIIVHEGNKGENDACSVFYRGYCTNT